MKSLKEIIEVGKKNGAINAGRDYLINNPTEFFELLKQDILLAEQYINFFDQSSVVSIIRHVQKKNENLFENLMKLSKTPDKIVISTPFIKITPQNVKQHLLEICDLFRSKEFAYKEDYKEDYYQRRTYFYKGLYLFKTTESILYETEVNNSNTHDLKNCEFAYHQCKHPQHVEIVMQRIMSSMINKIKDSNLMSQELSNAKDPDFNILMRFLELGRYQEVAQICALVAPEVIVTEKYITLLVNKLPDSTEALGIIFAKMNDTNRNVLTRFFHYASSNFLQTLKDKSQPLALALYNVSSGAARRHFRLRSENEWSDFPQTTPDQLPELAFQDQLKSLAELISLGQSHGVIGAGVQYLLNNPNEFVELIKKDIDLAQQYAQFFTPTQATQLVSTAYAQGGKFYTQIFNFKNKPSDIAPSNLKIEITNDNAKNFISQIIDKITSYPSMRKVDFRSYYHGTTYLFCYPSDWDFEDGSNYGLREINIENCTRVYKQLVTNITILHAILATLIHKMLHDFCIDNEFVENTSLLGQLFNGASNNLLLTLHHEKMHEEFLKVMSMMSSDILFPQLLKLDKELEGLLVMHLEVIVDKLKTAKASTIENFLNQGQFFHILFQNRRYEMLRQGMLSIPSELLLTQLAGSDTTLEEMFILKLIDRLPVTQTVWLAIIQSMKQVDPNQLKLFFDKLPIALLKNLSEKSLPMAREFYWVNPDLAKQQFQIDFELVPAFEKPLPQNPEATMPSYRDLINQLKNSSDVQVNLSFKHL